MIKGLSVLNADNPFLMIDDYVILVDNAFVLNN